MPGAASPVADVSSQDTPAPDEVAAELLDRGRSEFARGRPRDAIRLYRRALVSARGPELRARLLISLALAEYEWHGLAQATTRLAEAEVVVDRHGLAAVRAALHNQRGILHLRQGSFAAALVEFDAGVALPGDNIVEDRCRILSNRAIVHIERADVRAARTDLTLCIAEARRTGLRLHEAMAVHNLGYVEFLAGNLPVALRLMEAQRDNGYLAGGTGNGHWSATQSAAHGQNLRGLLAYYAVSHTPASLYAAVQAGDLVLKHFPEIGADADHTESLVSPMTLLYQATGEVRYRHWAAARAQAGMADGAGLCALYAATGENHYLRGAQRVWRQECARHRTDQDLAASLWTLTGAPGYAKALHPVTTPERYTPSGRSKAAT